MGLLAWIRHRACARRKSRRPGGEGSELQHRSQKIQSSVQYRDRLKAGPEQDQAEQVSKSKNKLLATMYKHFSRSLYKADIQK